MAANVKLTKNVPTVRSEQYRSVYVNHARGNLTNWEVQFTLGTIGDQGPNEPHMQEQVTLSMTTEFARALAKTLIETVDAHEATKKASAMSKAAAAPKLGPHEK